ncbi:DUF4190 domain-containing protein [Rummeliibacillus pycnus]|uniref:DUF4190 domain-containing protein n=1 Tax=Rummeliibacillus pycnus TaxID=101070 RepID=UPI0037CCB9AE
MSNTNSKSIASLIMGILSIFIPLAGLILGIVGIILSNISLKEMKVSSENGKGLAVSGMVCGIVGVCIHIILIGFIILGFLSFSLYNETGIK